MSSGNVNYNYQIWETFHLLRDSLNISWNNVHFLQDWLKNTCLMNAHVRILPQECGVPACHIFKGPKPLWPPLWFDIIITSCPISSWWIESLEGMLTWQCATHCVNMTMEMAFCYTRIRKSALQLPPSWKMNTYSSLRLCVSTPAVQCVRYVTRSPRNYEENLNESNTESMLVRSD